jgi:ATP-dependent protease ClpP protease subunit
MELKRSFQNIDNSQYNNLNFKEDQNNSFKLYKKYINERNCDKIILCNNHIYFNAIVTNYNIHKLIEFINTIELSYKNILKEYQKTIYIHINSKGGFLYSLIEFIEFKKNNNIELISIIDNECNDVAIILACLCNYRVINKKAICHLSKYNINCSNLNYWGYFKQCEYDNQLISNFYNELVNIFCNIIDSKITNEKLKKYLENNCIWDSKKYKKIGLADEIV